MLNNNELEQHWGVFGHDWAVHYLRLSIERDKVSHAYIFTGPPHVGKTALAIAFAKAISCESADDGVSAPCGECRSCKQIERNSHPDVRIIGMADQAALLNKDPAKQKELSINTIREYVVQTAANRPMLGRKKIYIIQDADRLSEEAANAMLKTLEEGTSFNMIILIASDESRMFPTILSRCQKISLRPVPRGVIARHLEEEGVEPDTANLLASLSHGRPGWAITAATAMEELAARNELVKTAAELPGQNRSDRIAAAEKLAKAFGTGKRDAVYDMLEAHAEWWRDVLLVKAGCADLSVNTDYLGEMARQAKLLNEPQIERSLRCVYEAMRQLDMNVNARLALESLFLEMPQITYNGQ